MGFFSRKDPLQQLTADIERNPNDPNLQLHLANALRAKGKPELAADAYLRAADLFETAGFLNKALSAVKQATQVSPSNISALERLEAVCAQLAMREDHREVMRKLAQLYSEQQRPQEAQQMRDRLASFGPGR